MLLSSDLILKQPLILRTYKTHSDIKQNKLFSVDSFMQNNSKWL